MKSKVILFLAIGLLLFAMGCAPKGGFDNPASNAGASFDDSYDILGNGTQALGRTLQVIFTTVGNIGSNNFAGGQASMATVVIGNDTQYWSVAFDAASFSTTTGYGNVTLTRKTNISGTTNFSPSHVITYGMAAYNPNTGAVLTNPADYSTFGPTLAKLTITILSTIDPGSDVNDTKDDIAVTTPTGNTLTITVTRNSANQVTKGVFNGNTQEKYVDKGTTMLLTLTDVAIGTVVRNNRIESSGYPYAGTCTGIIAATSWNITINFAPSNTYGFILSNPGGVGDLTGTVQFQN